jgi:peptide subunit release factor 1 (eRF1)
MITAETIRNITEFRGNGLPVVSAYVGAPHDPGAVLHQIRPLADDPSLSDAARDSLRADVERVGKALANKSSGTGSVAVFACAGKGFLQTVALPRTVRDRIVVDASPWVRPMTAVLDEYPRCCVLVLGQNLWEYWQGELRVVGEASGWHVAQLLRTRGCELLVVGGSADKLPRFVDALPPDLQALVAVTFVADRTSVDRVRWHAEAAVSQRRREVDFRLVSEIFTAGGDREATALGLPRCLRAGSVGAVGRLLVQDGASVTGVVCEACGWLGLAGRTCAACGCPVRRSPDVVDELVETVIDQGGSVRHIREKTPLAGWVVAAELRGPVPDEPMDGAELAWTEDLTISTGPTKELAGRA